MNKKQLFVERRPDGQYALERGGAGRAIGLFETQKEAIERGKAVEPDAHLLVERVRNVETGGRDKWRKP